MSFSLVACAGAKMEGKVWIPEPPTTDDKAESSPDNNTLRSACSPFQFKCSQPPSNLTNGPKTMPCPGDLFFVLCLCFRNTVSAITYSRIPQKAYVCSRLASWSDHHPSVRGDCGPAQPAPIIRFPRGAKKGGSNGNQQNRANDGLEIERATTDLGHTLCFRQPGVVMGW